MFGGQKSTFGSSGFGSSGGGGFGSSNTGGGLFGNTTNTSNTGIGVVLVLYQILIYDEDGMFVGVDLSVRR